MIANDQKAGTLGRKVILAVIHDRKNQKQPSLAALSNEQQ